MRRDAAGSDEFQPGSADRVLRNRPGITSLRALERKETEALLSATERLIDETCIDQRFTANDIRRIHRIWLQDIYAWAGEYRQVNIARGGLLFAASAQLPRLMLELERGPLRQYTPCRCGKVREQATALAVVHAELILIHPFRDGNGRCGRLLAVLMALQAGLPVLDFGAVRGARRQAYFSAVSAALGRDYAPMTDIFEDVIARTLRLAR
jgi:cell filamentation protein